MSMKHKLVDLKASGCDIAVVISTKTLRPGEWNTVPIFVIEAGQLVQLGNPYVLLVDKSGGLAREAQRLWPGAQEYEPDNTSLVTAQ